MAEPTTGASPDGGGHAQGAARRRPRKAELPRDPLGRLRAPGAPDALAHLKALRRDPPPAREAWHRAVSLQADQRCYEAYEHVVVAWRDPSVPEPDRPLWRALAQVAAGCCHVQRGNITGARKILARAAGGLRPYAPRHGPVDVEATLAGVSRLWAELDAGATPGQLPPLVALDGP